MSRASDLGEAYRLAALPGLSRVHRAQRVRWYLQARARASSWTRFWAAVSTWDLDKTDRARLTEALDAIAEQEE